MIFVRCDIGYTVEGVRRVLHRFGLRWLSPRPLHPETRLEVQEAFRRDF